MGQIDLTEASTRNYVILVLLVEGKKYYRGDICIEQIYMHGEGVGLGVKVVDFGWTTEIGEDNIFDPTKITEAQELVPKVQEIFNDLGLGFNIQIFHHLDLGG
jgi:hypothetical protein